MKKKDRGKVSTKGAEASKKSKVSIGDPSNTEEPINTEEPRPTAEQIHIANPSQIRILIISEEPVNIYYQEHKKSNSGEFFRMRKLKLPTSLR